MKLRCRDLAAIAHINLIRQVEWFKSNSPVSADDIFRRINGNMVASLDLEGEKQEVVVSNEKLGD